MPKKITKYKCDFCKRSYARMKAAEKHEGECFYNPGRTPKDGEMAIWDTLPRSLTQSDSYGIPGSDWLEPLEKCSDYENIMEKNFAWWPKDKDGELELGYIYRNGAWEKIPGYIPPTFSPGFTWVDEVVPQEITPDEW